MPEYQVNIERKRIALLLSPLNLQRLAPGLRGLVGPLCEFWHINTHQDEFRVLRDLERWNPDGIIAEADPVLMESVVSLGKPLVFAPGELVVEGFGCVSVDERAIGSLAAEHLLERGYAGAAFVGHDDPMEVLWRDSFCSVFSKAGIKCSVWGLTGRSYARNNEFTGTLSRSCVRWLERLPPGLGIFASSDVAARTVVEACRDLRIEIPEQIGLITSEDASVMSGLISPALSQVCIPWVRIGQEAGQLVLRMINGSECTHRIQVEPTGVRARESTQRINCSSGLVEKAISIMRSELSVRGNLDWLCRNLCVSRRRLEREFSTKGYSSPMAYWLDLRLERARELLVADPSKTIKELASSCGFPNVDSLSGRFKRTYGEALRDFRMRLRGTYRDLS
ncbi:substrate-binding domain-containing protein [Puniceicoccaceae bacterium K14]|nr:substrate-binding domain-containing protein [Puniceicoccaceae bacterium K14]